MHALFTHREGLSPSNLPKNSSLVILSTISTNTGTQRWVIQLSGNPEKHYSTFLELPNQRNFILGLKLKHRQYQLS